MRLPVGLSRSVLATALIAPSAWAAFPQIQLQTVTSGELVAPVGLTNAGDGSNRLFVIDQNGQIQIIQGGTVLPTPFLDIDSKVVSDRPGFDERGLLGLAFHPDFNTGSAAGEGKFYVYYSAVSPEAPGTTGNPIDHRSIIAEYMVSSPGSNIADPNSERILLTFNQPQFNHDAGQLAFGPDGMLYISTGDGGSSNDNNAGHTGGDATQPSGVLGNAQDRTNLLGKVLRIDVDGTSGPGGQYGIPADNPFVGVGGGVREEIYAYGLRNPWRFSFDDGPGGTNRLFLADVGQGEVEEVNIIESGKNYGWRIREGSSIFDGTVSPNPVVPLIDPIAEYTRAGLGPSTGLPEIGIATVGGFVYRGSELPDLVGKYIFGDWSTGFVPGNGTLLGLEETSPGNFDLSVLDVVGGNPIGLYITAFGEDEFGELYVVAKSALAPGLDPNTGLPAGTIFKIVPEPGELLGDVDLDGGIGAADIDTLYAEIPSSVPPSASRFDLNFDNNVDQADVDELVLNILGSRFGDFNLDLTVSFADFGNALQPNFGGPGGWADGDANGTGDTTFADFVILQNNFGTTGTGAPAAVPEPATLPIFVLASLTLLRRRRGA